jgi:hypothetical protein
MTWKVILRPVGLPIFVLSLLFLPFFPVVTVAGAVFYGGAVYWAVQRERNKALPRGTVDEVGKLPYRRRKLANEALAAARDIQQRLSALPRDVVSRLPLTAADAGRLAAAVVFYLRQEVEALKLAKVGGGEGAGIAKRAGESAEQTMAKVRAIQTALGALALASADVDRASLAAQADDVAAEIHGLKKAMVEARAELEAAPEFPALEPPAETNNRDGGQD